MSSRSRFSWADLEGLHDLVGDFGPGTLHWRRQAPNTLVLMITLNGASLSKDMAQRCIRIKLARPVFNPSWEAELPAVHPGQPVGHHRRPACPARSWIGPGEPGNPLGRLERDVLSKTEGWAQIQEEIKQRQLAVDDDDDEHRRVSSTSPGSSRGRATRTGSRFSSPA